MNTACMYLFEALSKHLLSSYPRLRSLRSFSLGLLRVCLSEALSSLMSGASRSAEQLLFLSVRVDFYLRNLYI